MEGCSASASEALLSSAVLGKPLEELFCDAARVKAQAAQAASASSAACAFPLQAIASTKVCEKDPNHNSRKSEWYAYKQCPRHNIM